MELLKLLPQKSYKEVEEQKELYHPIYQMQIHQSTLMEAMEKVAVKLYQAQTIHMKVHMAVTEEYPELIALEDVAECSTMKIYALIQMLME